MIITIPTIRVCERCLESKNELLVCAYCRSEICKSCLTAEEIARDCCACCLPVGDVQLQCAMD
jgi:hypothetical protein